jgi:hypothetical protein
MSNSVPGTCLERLSETIKDVSQDTDFNRVSAESNFASHTPE